MNRDWKISLVSCLLTVLLGGIFPIVGQKKEPASKGVMIEQERTFERQLAPDGPPIGDTVVFVASEMSFDGKTVIGAPYSAQAVTESTQTLVDGNRIVNKTTSPIYRDSEGRTRREQTLRAFGPFAAKGDSPQTIVISDPVAGLSYMLDPRTRTARKMPAFKYELKTPPRRPAPGAEDQDTFIEAVPSPGIPVGPPAPGEGPAGEGPPAEMFTLRRLPPKGGQFVFSGERAPANKAVTEKLESQIIEGVMAEGSRTTTTIPAGEIGNDRAIEIVTERWYSPEIKTVVMTRHSDPRFGETVYRLTNINRSEPARALFEVPADYTVKEEPEKPMRWRRAAPPQP